MRAHLIAGPEQHGVTRFALEVAGTPALHGDAVVRVQDAVGAHLADEVRAQAPTARTVHVNVTDRLFGNSATQAADALTALGAAMSMTVTLHDLPQPSDGHAGFTHRAAAYARIVAASRGIIVSSRHEALLLKDALHQARADLSTPLEVVPLPIEQQRQHPLDPPPPHDTRDLVLLGFLYPGKGHTEALTALSALPPDVGLVALGRPSPGHDDLVQALTDLADRMGRRFEVTGYVPDDQLPGRLVTSAVPVAPHRHLSASGSIGSWLSAGRRPLVPRSRYVEELDERCPGALWLYDDRPGALEEACAEALLDPARTWIAPGIRLGPSRAEVGDAYRQILDTWHP